MTDLFRVLDAIVRTSSFAHEETTQTLNHIDDIVRHADAIGVSISREQAERISQAGLAWVSAAEGGDEDWSFYREEAKRQLELAVTHLRDPHTGRVDSAENWQAEKHTPENADLVEVVKDASGEWVETE